MTKHEKLLSVEHVIQLSERLSAIPEIAKFSAPNEPQGMTIAHALSHWEDACAKILDDLLPKLLKPSSADDVVGLLTAIGDELRHILYHVQDTQYFGYLSDRK